MGWISGAIQGAANLGSSLIDRRTQRKLQQKAFKNSKKEATLAYERDLEMWDRQNRYNTPSAQMSRFEEAGLNKNLIYGRGESGNAGQMPNYQQVTDKAPDMPELKSPDMIGMYQNIKQARAQLNVTRAQENNIKQDTVNKGTENLLKTWGVNTAAQKYGQSKGLYAGQLSMQSEDIRKRQQEISNLMSSQKGIQAKNSFQLELNKLAKEGIFVGDDWQKGLYRDIRKKLKF